MKRFTKQACRENVVASFFSLNIYIYIYIYIYIHIHMYKYIYIYIYIYIKWRVMFEWYFLRDAKDKFLDKILSLLKEIGGIRKRVDTKLE